MKKLSAGFKTRSFFRKPEFKTKPLRVVGINSGTSCDGLDSALVEFVPGNLPRLLFSKTYPYSPKVRETLLTAGDPGFKNGEYWMKFNSKLGKLMGEFASDFLSMAKKKRLTPHLMASHGHTIRHLPGKSGGSFTLQIGEPSQIASLTGLPVISDFRSSDIAAGGQGAPLSPLLHEKLFRSRTRFRAVVNIGGIANITVLPPEKSRKRPFAADCGPGNMVVDSAMKILYGRRYDMDGETALRGEADKKTVNRIMRMSFFKSPPPKSTGREQFGHGFLGKIFINCKGYRPEDIIATISEITIRAIADFISRYAPGIEEIYLCGGGAGNKYIVAGLNYILRGADIRSTSELGYDPDYIEAMLWAYLGYCFAAGIRVDSNRFTGAKKTYIPGKLCLP
ncbi:MAG: anhydro-N-acetylmuramic acid kinase [Candidatus Zixiibacteriota bacterium]|nr:MAG: anhydro-N-acetylmuramic acid kinase [candidate division Zixibacteria bacterium]